MLSKKSSRETGGFQMSVAHTCTHDVVSEEWRSEPKGQHEQVAGEARVQLPEACSVGAEVREGSRHQHAVRMEAHHVVVLGVQVGCLHELGRERKEEKNESVDVASLLCLDMGPYIVCTSILYNFVIFFFSHDRIIDGGPAHCLLIYQKCWWPSWLQPKHVPAYPSFNSVFDPLNPLFPPVRDLCKLTGKKLEPTYCKIHTATIH